MEQIQQLLEILKQTPEMAMWGLVVYFLFILLKAASWIGALLIVAKQFIKRFFDYREEQLRVKEKKMHLSKAQQVVEYFEDRSIGSKDSNNLILLLNEIAGGSNKYIHDSDLDSAMKAIKAAKKS